MSTENMQMAILEVDMDTHTHIDENKWMQNSNKISKRIILARADKGWGPFHISQCIKEKKKNREK